MKKSNIINFKNKSEHVESKPEHESEHEIGSKYCKKCEDKNACEMNFLYNSLIDSTINTINSATMFLWSSDPHIQEKFDSFSDFQVDYIWNLAKSFKVKEEEPKNDCE